MNIERKALFDATRTYRYQLWRDWDKDSLNGTADDLPNVDKFVLFIGLNPSTADETMDDPTIRRCIGFAKRWGYGSLCMANLFAFRATKPRDMMVVLDPIGPFNDEQLASLAIEADLIVCAWGKDGDFKARDEAGLSLLWNRRCKMTCFGFNVNGTPKHPLYQKKDAVLVSVTADGVRNFRNSTDNYDRNTNSNPRD